MYAESPGSIAGGKELAPVVIPNMEAWDGFAVGRKAFAVVTVPFVLVWREISLVWAALTWL